MAAPLSAEAYSFTPDKSLKTSSTSDHNHDHDHDSSPHAHSHSHDGPFTLAEHGHTHEHLDHAGELRAASSLRPSLVPHLTDSRA